MSAALLTIQQLPGEVTFSFGDEEVLASVPSPSVELVEGAMNAAAEQWGTGPVSPLIATAADSLLPTELENRLSRWASVESDERTLCVACDDSSLMPFPWEAMLRLRFSEIRDLFVARVVAAKGAPPFVAATGKSPMLLAGWARLEGSPFPGIERELREVRERLKEGRIEVHAMGSPTASDLKGACVERKPRIVHLTSPGISDWWNSAQLAVAAEVKKGKSGQGSPNNPAVYGGGSPAEMLPAKQVAAILKSSPNLALVVLNTCHSGLGASRDIVSICNAACVGWASYVQDEIAADFAAYFYQRLLEGYSVIGAARSFAKLGHQGVGEPMSTPSVWLPSPVWANWTPFPQRSIASTSLKPEKHPGPTPVITEEPRARRSAGRKKQKDAGIEKSLGGLGVRVDDEAPVYTSPPAPPQASVRQSSPVATDAPVPAAVPSSPSVTPAVEIDLKLREAINPALLLNGNSPLQHLNFDSDREVKLVRIEIECDAGGSASTYCRTMRLREGPNPITDLDSIVFPALFDLASRDAPRRMINFTVRLSQGFGLSAEVLAEKTLSVQWMARNEWLDRGELWAFIPAFVQPNSRGVRRVLDDAVRMLRFIGGPDTAFDGYQSDDLKHVSSQVRAIFQTLRDDPYGVTYINPLAGPVYEGGARSPAGQFVRFPDEIIEHKRATCHDLTLMFASCLEHVGIRPIIVLVRGHTFLGFWRRAQYYEKYWKEARSESGRAEANARSGLITKLTRFRECVVGGDDAQIEIFECTRATDRNATYEDAVKQARERVGELRAEYFQAAVDVFAARAQVQPL